MIWTFFYVLFKVINTIMIDTHCHLYSKEFENDLEDIIERAVGKGVQRFYMPAIDMNTTEAMLKVEEMYPNQCFSMIGLHPCSVKGNFEDEMGEVRNWLRKRAFVAIGEIGLDFYWDKSFITEQYAVFRNQAELAIEYNLPIVIHSRNATVETIKVMTEFSGTTLTGIFHCFGGTLEEAKQITDLGYYLGIGGVITYKNAGLAEVVSQIDLSHIVLETDAPYLAPAPYRGKRNESSYLEIIAQKVALAKGISIEQVVSATSNNALSIFSHNRFIEQ